MLKTKEISIDGKNFKVTQLGYGEGMELLTKLISIAGQAFEKNLEKESFSLARLATNLKAQDLKMVVDKLSSRTLIERESGSDMWPKLDAEVDFSGEYGLMLKWLKFALEVNYRSFFSEGGILKGGGFFDLEGRAQAV